MKGDGFTLVELLVVLAIITALAGVVLVSVSGARSKGDDAKRVSDIGQIALAVRLYAEQNSTYPTCGSGSPVEITQDTCMQTALSTFFSTIPDDTETARYMYDSNGCNNRPVVYVDVTTLSNANWPTLCGGTDQRYATVF